MVYTSSTSKANIVQEGGGSAGVKRLRRELCAGRRRKEGMTKRTDEPDSNEQEGAHQYRTEEKEREVEL